MLIMDEWTEKEWAIFFDIYEQIPRQGPGDIVYTKQAFEYLKELPEECRIAEVGCGTGQSTIELAKASKGEVWALDNHSAFLDILKEESQKQHINNIKTVEMDMCKLSVPEKYFDVIWAEGSIYFYGYQNALKDWQKFFRGKPTFAFSEPNWFVDEVPKEIYKIWMSEYPQITHIDNTLKSIQNLGYKVINHFKLPSYAWSENYYKPLKIVTDHYLSNHEMNESVKIVTDSIYQEIKEYDQYGKYYGYTFYICEKNNRT